MVEALEQLKKRLPKGWTVKLAKEFNCSPMTVTNALQGKHRRYDIIEGALRMANETIEIENKLKQVANHEEALWNPAATSR